ncbi:glycosyltransferase family 39 protein [Candidatus Fermentibacteria bacterium]|nr:glycosyltransferase family 39 protein [Candidatus Fermentibacteria bacterium]
MEALLLGAALLAGLALRVRVAVLNPMPSGDGIASDMEMARGLSEGGGFSTMRKWTLYDPSMEPVRPEGNRQPAVSVLLAGLFLLTGVSFSAAQAASVVVGLACIAAAWAWSRKALGPVPAVLLACWLALDPLFVWYSTQPDSLMLFTGLFFAILLAAGVGAPGPRRAAALGAICGLAWLTRTQALPMAAGVFIALLPGSKRKAANAAAFAVVFLLVVSPWLVRNWQAFGSPLFSQNGQFLLNENHWAAWEVRSSAPTPLDILRHQGFAAVLAALVRGLLRVLEPFTTGTLHRGEVFGGPSLAVFAIGAILALRDAGVRRSMLVPALAGLPMLAVLVLHEHPTRYMAFATASVVALGAKGLLDAASRLGAGRAAKAAALAVVALPLARPLGAMLVRDGRPAAEEAREVSSWLAAHTRPSDWVVTFPNVELLIWEYRRPTLTMPNDYEMLLWPCLEEHGVRFVVVDPDLPRMRPRLSTRWRMNPDGTAWEVTDPPPFLAEVYRSGSGRTIVYEWTGTVPEGFMAVDSLPRDNCRALPPQ